MKGRNVLNFYKDTEKKGTVPKKFEKKQAQHVVHSIMDCGHMIIGTLYISITFNLLSIDCEKLTFLYLN